MSANTARTYPLSLVPWALVFCLAFYALYTLATARGEPVNAMWLVTAAIGVYAIGYRFYSRFIADKVLGLDASRRTPAHRRNDGLDYVPTDKWVLFGHHFAAIAGAGPLVGPVLAAQMGYLPGTLWLLTGVIFAGAAQDFLVLFISTRRDGRSLGDLIKTEMGHVPGVIAMVGILSIMIILLAVLALVVVKALADSPWGAFTVFATLPIAVFMGVYGRYIRPGRIGEMSIIGFMLLLASIAFGRTVAESATLAPLFAYKGETLAFMLIAYGFVASVLPVWLLLAPRDYLSTFLKIGTILSLALGIFIVWPDLQMPAVSRFIDGAGPVFAGSVFPFLFITIACGAVSGFHALVSSGTTPKMIADETQTRFIGYGAMLMESFVAIMALIAASVLEPGVYFAMNSAPAVIGATPDAAATAISAWGFAVTPETLQGVAHDVGEKTILSRTGGAPTLAVGMAHILSKVIGGGDRHVLLVSLRHPVRGALHPDDDRRRHARRALHDPGPRRRLFSGLRQYAGLGAESRRHRHRRHGLGLFPLSGRDRPLGRHQHALALVRHRQPDARGHGADALHRRALPDEARALRLRGDRADDMALYLHADGGARKNLPRRSEDRLPRPCENLRGRRGQEQDSRAGEDARRNASRDLQRLCRCEPLRDLYRARSVHPRLRDPFHPRRARVRDRHHAGERG